MSRGLLRIVLLALAFGLGTYAFGWWAVPIVAFVWGVMSGGSPRGAVRAGAAAALAWIVLLVAQGLVRPAVFPFGRTLAGAMQMPGWALWAAEIVFPLVLAWSSALLGSAFRRRLPPRDRAPVAQ
ncbi:MAG: hypothetical protein ACRENQ_05705 [Gemmatimonadaceae bacterium]